MTTVKKKVGGVTFVANVPTEKVAGTESISSAMAYAIEVAISRELIMRGLVTPDAFAFVRKAAKLRASDIAERFDTTPKTISRWETGEVSIPRPNWAALALLFAERADVPGVTMGDMLAMAAVPNKTKDEIEISLGK